MKPCTKCKTKKPLSEFPKDNTRKDGLSYYCKDCRNSWIREYQRRPEVKKMRMEKIRNKEREELVVLTAKNNKEDL